MSTVRIARTARLMSVEARVRVQMFIKAIGLCSLRRVLRPIFPIRQTRMVDREIIYMIP